MTDRILGVIGLLTVAGAAGWAVVGGDALPVGAVVVVGTALTVADAVAWRGADTDLAVPEGARLPSAPWGILTGPAGAFGLLAGVVTAAVLVAVLSGLLLAVSLAGTFVRFPAGSLPLRSVWRATRIRRFVHAHGGEAGGRVAGYRVRLGAAEARIFVFAPDGTWDDVVVPRDDASLVAELARIDLVDATEQEAGRRLVIGPRFWASMNASW